MIKFMFILFVIIYFATCMTKRSNKTNYRFSPPNQSTALLEHRIDISDDVRSQSIGYDPNMTQNSQRTSPQNVLEHHIEIPENIQIEQDGEGQKMNAKLPMSELLTTPVEEKLQNKINNNLNGNSSAVFEHRIDIPEPETFLEQFESPYDQKVKINPENAIEFLKLLPDLSLSLNSPKFNRMRIDLQLYVIYTKIFLIFKEKHHEIGESLISVNNKFVQFCHQIGDDGKDGNSQTRIIDTKDLGKRFCFLGMFVSLAELLNTKMTEILEQFTKKHIHWVSGNRKLRRELGLVEFTNDDGPRQFLDGLSASQLMELHTLLTFYSMSIEQLFMLWMKAKEKLTSQKYVENKSKYSISGKAKKHLNELTRENLKEFVSKRIDAKNM